MTLRLFSMLLILLKLIFLCTFTENVGIEEMKVIPLYKFWKKYGAEMLVDVIFNKRLDMYFHCRKGRKMSLRHHRSRLQIIK